MADISFNNADKKLKIAQIAKLCMLMRKSVNNDVSKDSPYNGTSGNRDSSYF